MYIQDGKGRIYCLNRDSDLYTEVYKFTEGSVAALCASPTHNYAVSLGETGQLKVWDYAKKSVFAEKIFSGKGTCLTHLPQTDANKGRLFVAGFDNGIVRFCNVNSEGVEIMKSFKAHDSAIVGVKFSADLKLCVTASVSGEIFFFDMDGHKDTQKYDPLCCL